MADVMSAKGTLCSCAAAGDTEGFGVISGGSSSGVADLLARGATLLRLAWAGFLRGASSSSGAVVAVVVVVVAVAAVWSGSNTSLGSTMEGGATLLFLGGRPRRLGGAAGSGASADADVEVVVVLLLLLWVARRGLGAGAGVKSSPLSSAAAWGVSAESSSEESTTTCRRAAARRDGRVDMAMGYLWYLKGKKKGREQNVSQIFTRRRSWKLNCTCSSAEGYRKKVVGSVRCVLPKRQARESDTAAVAASRVNNQQSATAVQATPAHFRYLCVTRREIT
jgi:hypothetical protein